MKPRLSRWLSPWPALAFSLGGLLLGMWLLPARPPNEQLAQPSSTNGVPVPALPPQRLDDDGYRAEVRAQFAEIRRQARAARETPDVAALLALAAAGGAGIPGSPGDEASRERLLAQIGAMTPTQCWRTFQQLLTIPPDTAGLEDVFLPLVESLLSRGIKGQAEAIVRTLPEQEDQGFYPMWSSGYAELAIEAWGHTDPQAAADFVSRQLDGEEGPFSWEGQLKVLCKNWHQTDPASALAWAKALPDADVQKVYAFEGIFGHSNESGLEEEKACVERMAGLNKAVPQMAAEVAVILARPQLQESDGPQAATQWVLSLPSLPERRKALSAVAEEYGNSVGVRPMVQWATFLPSDEARGAAWATVANDWEACDASGQPTHASSVDEFRERLRANADVVNSWLTSLPAGADRDAAIAIHHQWEDHSLNGAIIWR